ncbi:flagellar hook-length control protein FliK [Persephonella sp.]
MINIKPFNFNYEFLTIAKPQGKSITIKPGETVRAEVIDILPSGGVVLRMKGGHLTVNTEIPLQKDTSLLLKILNTPEMDHRLKFQIVAVLGKEGSISLNPRADLSLSQLVSLLSSGKLKDSFINSLMEMLPQKFNTLDNSQKNILVSILLNSINSSGRWFFQKAQEMFKENFVPIRDLTPDRLRNAILNTGVFFESKLKKGSVSIDDDLKFKALKSIGSGDESLRELVRVIDHFQVISRLTDGVFTFLPILWNDLERGDIYVQEKSRNGKKGFLCTIDLNFSDLGDLQISIFLYEKDLMITFFVQNDSFRELINNEIKELKDRLSVYFDNVFLKFKTKKEENLVLRDNILHLKV